MARRFTDTEKWDDPWFADLDKEGKLIACYLNDRCSHAGIWKVNFKYLRFHCDTDRSEEEIREIMKGRYYEFDDKWLLPKFLRFQYPKGLQSSKPAIVSVRNELNRYGLSQIITELLPNDYSIIKDNTSEKSGTSQSQGQAPRYVRKSNTAQVREILERDPDNSKYVPRPKS